MIEATQIGLRDRPLSRAHRKHDGSLRNERAFDCREECRAAATARPRVKESMMRLA